MYSGFLYAHRMLMRTRPFNPVFDRHPLDRLLDQRTPVVDAAWKDRALVLTADLPGTPAEAVDVSVAGRVLTIAVATDELSWKRSVKLGAALDAEKVSACYADGRLTVTVAAIAAAEPRRIEIQAADQADNGTSGNG
jgi:HSP20 family molecular chaperone IbpA